MREILMKWLASWNVIEASGNAGPYNRGGERSLMAFVSIDRKESRNNFLLSVGMQPLVA